jgi:1-aminocyclopropane-1-carboxylate deaminase/D-cysteine desulfhydrase-like pyridoxal-dependent ACC family enzyme
MFGRHEGVILDPIYTGKCAAAMTAHIREARFGADDIVVIVHIGGMPAIFTWNDNLLAQVGWPPSHGASDRS